MNIYMILFQIWKTLYDCDEWVSNNSHCNVSVSISINRTMMQTECRMHAIARCLNILHVMYNVLQSVSTNRVRVISVQAL